MGRSRARVGRIIRGPIDLIAIRRFELLRIHLVSERDGEEETNSNSQKRGGASHSTLIEHAAFAASEANPYNYTTLMTTLPTISSAT